MKRIMSGTRDISSPVYHGYTSSASRRTFYDLVIFIFVLLVGTVTSNSGNTILVRIRKIDGSMDRVVVPIQPTEEGESQHDNVVKLSDILSNQIHNQDEETDEKSDSDSGIIVKIDAQDKSYRIEDTFQPIQNFKLRNGSLITIIPSVKKTKQQQSSQSTNKKDEIPKKWTTFIPFPSIAKSTSYSSVVRRSKALSRLPSKRGMSYSDLSNLRKYMHAIEPQSVGPLLRIYMCHVSAQRFKDSTTTSVPMKVKKGKKKGKQYTQVRIENKCAILFGTLHKERVDLNKVRSSRTSLSTPLDEVKMCTVAKVQALWEVPADDQQESSSSYDKSGLWRNMAKNGEQDPSLFIKEGEYRRVFEIAELLGLRPVGWIYSYSDSRNEDNDGLSNTTGDVPETDEDALPVHGIDVINGSRGQLGNMQYLGKEEGIKYVTLAMDSNTGATEAFQMSDVSVQMVAEGILTDKNLEKGRFVKTSDPVLVDNKETQNLDSVLCLVNTAMVSHTGKFSGVEGLNTVKKNGMLTPKYKRQLLMALNENFDNSLCDKDSKSSRNDSEAIRLLSSLNVLLVLDKVLTKNEIGDLCKVLMKYAKGQRKGATLGNQLKMALKIFLEG